MSLRLDSDLDTESSYADSIDDDHNDTPNPSPVQLQESSHDEYTHSTLQVARTDLSQSLQEHATNLRKYVTRSMAVASAFPRKRMTPRYVIPRGTKCNMLTLYEYCLGLEFKTLHVNSRANLFHLASNWHTRFDSNHWFLLPDAATLGDINQHVKAVIKGRQGLDSNAAILLRSKWQLNTRTQYTFISVSCATPPCRTTDGQSIVHGHPYPHLPLLESHISPPFSVINAGPKLSRDQINEIVLGLYPEQTERSEELKQRLTLLCNTWDLFMRAKSAALAWGEPEVGVSYIKRQKTDDWEVGIKQWVAESTRVSPSGDPNLPLDFALA